MLKIDYDFLENPKFSFRLFRDRGNMDAAHLTFTGVQLYIYKLFIQVFYES